MKIQLAPIAKAAVQIANPLNTNSFPELLTKIASAIGMLVTGLGTIMFIYAGILFLISAGSPERLGKAKTAVIYAIAGIAIGLAAQGITELIKTIIM
jgi:hypothetical protein